MSGCRHGYGRMVVGYTELLQRWCESDVDSKNSIGKKKSAGVQGFSLYAISFKRLTSPPFIQLFPTLN